MTIGTSSTVSTFAIFQQLVTASVNKDSDLDAAAKASMLTRLASMARQCGLVEDFSTVESSVGSVTVDAANKSIEVAIGATGTNRVVFTQRTWQVPMTVAGTLTATGFFTGNTGTSANAAVADADISMQYRFGANDTWKNFDKATVLSEVTVLQIAVDIADQVAATALPGIVLIATQE
jgi:hypothetical protein